MIDIRRTSPQVGPYDAPMSTEPAVPPVISLFDRAAQSYEDVGVDFFTTFGRRLVDAAGIAAGDQVLDVGCGTGAVLLPAAVACGPDGHVMGIDLAEGMLARCRANARAAGFEHVTITRGDAAAPDAPDASIDVVTSGLVIFFLQDPGAALNAYRRVLRPGGTLALSTFGEEDRRLAPVMGTIASFVETDPDAPPPRRAQQGPFVSSDSISELLQHHGFVEVDHTVENNDIRFPDAEKWIEWSWSHGARVLWESVPEHRRSDAHAAAHAALREVAEPDGSIVHRWPVRYTVARRP